ncbi:hypothetical protein [Microbacterium sp. AR7-10]|uniref:hypothetical protein n=1 Tax=Microbacterium sp. AR7-10 TaxID=1891970 RepID=UPI000AF32F4F|nr:hypothetical protein [Microbacterium sp. AR7-10]
MDITTLTDAELDQHRLDVLNEMERRANLAAIPAQVTALAQTYTAAGGDPADLTAALG